MTRSERIIAAVMWGLLIVPTLGLLALWAGQAWRHTAVSEMGYAVQASHQTVPLFDVPAFSLTDQNGSSISKDELRGHVWVAAFIFTRCPGPCPRITQKMAVLQKQLSGTDVRLVSFSLDPAYDTPGMLKDYAARFGADGTRWHFLTGDKSAAYRVAAGMKLTAIEANGQDPIFHSTKLVLVDQQGQVNGYYDSTDNDELAKLPGDARDLAQAARGNRG